jgi:hypothetical protein
MDNDVIGEMNRELGIGAGLDVDDNQRFEYLRESHGESADSDEGADDDDGET